MPFMIAPIMTSPTSSAATRMVSPSGAATRMVSPRSAVATRMVSSVATRMVTPRAAAVPKLDLDNLRFGIE